MPAILRPAYFLSTTPAPSCHSSQCEELLLFVQKQGGLAAGAGRQQHITTATRTTLYILGVLDFSQQQQQQQGIFTSKRFLLDSHSPVWIALPGLGFSLSSSSSTAASASALASAAPSALAPATAPASICASL